MAVNVVGKAPEFILRANCPKCASILEYTRIDVSSVKVSDYGGGTEMFHSIVCPNCSNRVGVKAP
jgi:glutaredoxin-related protein